MGRGQQIQVAEGPFGGHVQDPAGLPEILAVVLAPANRPAVAADGAALAALLDGQGKFAEAERLYQRALAVFERLYGPQHYEIALNLNNLAALYAAQGNVRKAEPLYRRALALKEKLLGPKHPDMAMTLNNLAVLCQARSQYDEAAALFRRALKIFQKALGPDHPNVGACPANYELLQEGGRGRMRQGAVP